MKKDMCHLDNTKNEKPSGREMISVPRFDLPSEEGSYTAQEQQKGSSRFCLETTADLKETLSPFRLL